MFSMQLSSTCKRIQQSIAWITVKPQIRHRYHYASQRKEKVIVAIHEPNQIATKVLHAYLSFSPLRVPLSHCKYLFRDQTTKAVHTYIATIGVIGAIARTTGPMNDFIFFYMSVVSVFVQHGQIEAVTSRAFPIIVFVNPRATYLLHSLTSFADRL